MPRGEGREVQQLMYMTEPEFNQMVLRAARAGTKFTFKGKLGGEEFMADLVYNGPGEKTDCMITVDLGPPFGEKQFANIASDEYMDDIRKKYDVGGA